MTKKTRTPAPPAPATHTAPPPPEVPPPPPERAPIDWDARKKVLASHELPKSEFGQTRFVTKFEIASLDGKEPKLFIRTWKESAKYNGPTGEGGSWTYEQLEELRSVLEHMTEVWDNLPAPKKGGR